MNRAESQLIVGDGSVLTAEGDEVGVGANATNPNPTRLVADHPQLDSFSGVQVTLFVGSACTERAGGRGVGEGEG